MRGRSRRDAGELSVAPWWDGARGYRADLPARRRGRGGGAVRVAARGVRARRGARPARRPVPPPPGCPRGEHRRRGRARAAVPAGRARLPDGRGGLGARPARRGARPPGRGARRAARQGGRAGVGARGRPSEGSGARAVSVADQGRAAPCRSTSTRPAEAVWQAVTDWAGPGRVDARHPGRGRRAPATAATSAPRCGAFTGVGPLGFTDTDGDRRVGAAAALRGAPHRQGRARRRRVRGGASSARTGPGSSGRSCWTCRWARSDGLGWPLVRPVFRAGVEHSLRDGAAVRGAVPGGRRRCEPVRSTLVPRCGWASSAPGVRRLPRRRVGPPAARRHRAVRAAEPGGLPVGAVLAGDPAQAARVPRGVRRVRPRGGRRVRRRRRARGCSPTRASSATAPRSRPRCTTPGGCWSSTPRSTSCSGRSRRTRRAPARPATLADVPATVGPESTAMAKELKRRGLRFVGPTTCYALMQAAGLVDDHVADLLARCH